MTTPYTREQKIQIIDNAFCHLTIRISGIRYQRIKKKILQEKRLEDAASRPLGWEWIKSKETIESLAEKASFIELTTMEYLSLDYSKK